MEDKSNLDTKYYEVEPTGYIFRNFTVAEADTLTLDFYAVEGKPFNPNKRYRLYYSEDGRRNYWNLVGDLTYNADTQTLQATGFADAGTARQKNVGSVFEAGYRNDR